MAGNSLDKLQLYRNALVSQDAVLEAAMRTKGDHEVLVPGLVPIKRIFDEIRTDFSELIPQFNFHGQPSPLRAQIAGAVSRIDFKIAELQREAAEEADRNELKFGIGPARELLTTRIEEGKGIREFTGNNLDLLGHAFPWAERTSETLKMIFATGWHERQFKERVGLRDFVGPQLTFEAAMSHLASGIAYLELLNEQLYLIECAGSGKIDKGLAGDRVFIGHGHSLIWREMKDFIEDRLHLKSDEFNREPTAGVFTPERLQQMQADACFALLIMTGEDEQPSGALRARENVVHEVGLFQGMLGFRRAIVLLEAGCEAFSNIHGLTVIPFPKGHINATFEDIRRTLEREGIILAG